jgi:benzodiazapine receptor
MKILFNWVLFIVVIAVNALANILPINGYNTGQISGFYPNYFVPAGFTFSIWGIIYLSFLVYSITYTYYQLNQDKFPVINQYLDKVSPWYWATCILNASWILAWHYLQVLLSVLIMLLFLFALIQIFKSTQKIAKEMNLITRLSLVTPFSIYIGWISVATIANVTALLVKYQWTGGIHPIYWSVIMIFVAVIAGVYFMQQFKTISYPLVIAWAIWGIKAAQGAKSNLIETASVIGLFILISLTSKLTIQKAFSLRN